MKQLLFLVVGIIFLPLICIVIFSFCNWILSLLFCVPFMTVQKSDIWLLESILTVFIIIFYFCEKD
jgi:hypothetical protein